MKVTQAQNRIAIVGMSLSFAGGGRKAFWRYLMTPAGGERRTAAHTAGSGDHESSLVTAQQLIREALEDTRCADLLTLERTEAILDLGSDSAAEVKSLRDACLAEPIGGAPINVSVDCFPGRFDNLALAVRRLQQRAADTILAGDLYPANESVLRGAMLVLRRLRDAQRDGNLIYAVIKHFSAFELDSRDTSGGHAEISAALKQEYQTAGINPRSVGFVELCDDDCADGAARGLESLTQVFGARAGVVPWCAVSNGSWAAGSAAVVKAALALHRAIVPRADMAPDGFNLDQESTPFYATDKPRPWIHGDPVNPRHAAIHHSTPDRQTHVVLAADESAPDNSTRHDSLWPTELLCFSTAGRAELLSRLSECLAALSDDRIESLERLAFQCARETRKACRLVIIARDLDDLARKLTLAINHLERTSQPSWQLREGILYGAPEAKAALGKIAFTFPGYGSYYRGLLSDLCLAFPRVRRWFDGLDGIFDEAAGPLPSQLLYPPPAVLSAATKQVLSEKLHGMRGGAQAGLVASLAMHELLVDLGIRCDVMVGHSNGENAALIAAGAMKFRTRDEFFGLIKRFTVHDDRQVSTDHLPKGVFFSVSGLRPDAIAQLIDESHGQLHLAMDNCPHQVVLFAGQPVAAAIARRVSEAGGIAVQLPFDRAYHTRLYESQRETLLSIYDSIEFAQPERPIYSCVTADLFPGGSRNLRELAIKQWSSCVRFRATIEKLYDDGVRTFIELGPNATLTSFTRDTLRDRKHSALACDSPAVPGITQLQWLLAALITRGEDPNLDYLFKIREVTSDAPAQVRELSSPSAAIETQETPALPSTSGTDVLLIETGNGQGGMQPLNNSPTDAKQIILAGHTGLMREFLDSQQRVLASVMEALAANSPQPESATAATSRPWPLIGKTIQLTKLRSYSERTFTVDSDPFLGDHAIGRPFPGDSTVSGLPVIPFVVSMEIAAEAASELVADDCVVAAISGIRGHRWLAVETGALRVGIEAEIKSSGPAAREVKVQLFELSADAAGTRQPAFEATIHLVSNFSSAPVRPLPDQAGAVLSANQIYPELLFHGPSFQSIKRVISCSETEVTAELEVPPFSNFTAGLKHPRFTTPAGLLDAAGQMVALWIVARGARDFNVFPFQAERFEQYLAPPGAGERVWGRASVQWINDLVLEGSVAFLDDRGRVFARVVGLRMRNYANEYITKLLAPPSLETFFSEPFMQRETNMICRTVNAETAKLIDSGIWKQVLARLVLNQSEFVVWSGLPAKGKRRLEWLLGRVTAKDVVRQWSAESAGIILAPAEIEISRDGEGCPFIKCEKLDRRGLRPHISISHTAGQAVSIADASRVGIDIELLSARSASEWAHAALDHDEMAIAGQENSTLLKFWCAKEAAAKARGTGLRGNPRAWRITSYSPEPQQVKVAYGATVSEVALWSAAGAVIAVCRVAADQG